jgi:hypothetical protein
MVPWMLAITVSLVLLIVSAASRPGNVAMGYVHLSVAATTCIFYALQAIKELRVAQHNNETRTALAARSARYVGVVWTWAALVVFVTYGLGVMMPWREWQAHFLAMTAVAGLSLALAAFLGKSAADGQEDETLLKVARYLAIGQLVVMLLVIVGFAVDGHMSRFLTERFVDWPAKHVMFFGAMAIAAISAASLKKLN